MNLKLLIVSDIHGSKKSLDRINASIYNQNPDAVVLCGDITHFGGMHEAVDIIEHIDINEIVGIIGNCDNLSVKDAFDSLNKAYIDINTYELNGHILAGLSGHNHSKSRLKDFKNIASRADIFVLHSPPYGYLDEVSKGKHIGERGLLKVISKTKPKLVLSGHIHECKGIIEEENTVYVNPGPAYEDNLALVNVGDKVDAALI